MSSLGGILGIARLAITAHQTAIQVTSHNVANAETPGYTRQRAVLHESWPVPTRHGVLGTGVLVGDVGQVRDTLLDASFRRESSQASGYGLRRDLLGQLEGIFGEPSDQAFGATLDAFWNSWADLANTPTNPTAREVVRAHGSQVALALNGYARRLGEVAADTAVRLEHAVGQLNEYGRQVAELNTQIVSLEVGGHTAGDLRDTRNRTLDAMARLADVQVHERHDGSVAVVLTGQSLVDGSDHKTVAVSGGPTSTRITFAGSSQSLPPLGGELSTMLDVLDREIPQVRGRLDELASGIVSAVNALHRTGWSAAAEPVAPGPPAPVAPPGWTGSRVDFFDPAGTTATTIAVAAGVLANRDMIAAGTVYGGTGDNAVARDLARLRDTAVSVGVPPTATVLGTHYRDTVTGVAMKVDSAESSATVFETLATQTDTRRQSVGGVTTDEELILLMRHQQAYVAATRLVSAVDEMTQELLNMVWGWSAPRADPRPPTRRIHPHRRRHPPRRHLVRPARRADRHRGAQPHRHRARRDRHADRRREPARARGGGRQRVAGRAAPAPAGAERAAGVQPPAGAGQPPGAAGSGRRLTARLVRARTAS